MQISVKNGLQIVKVSVAERRKLSAAHDVVSVLARHTSGKERELAHDAGEVLRKLMALLDGRAVPDEQKSPA